MKKRRPEQQWVIIISEKWIENVVGLAKVDDGKRRFQNRVERFHVVSVRIILVIYFPKRHEN